MTSSNELRRTFLEYFRACGHEIVPSSPLVPGNDPTLLFTNAGMVQFKDVFLGAEKRPYRRAVTAQRCVRAGGKHNDLENVGYTARHHTFFEMLGNFSFGDYFKREAIGFCWQFMTEELGLPSERLWVTVFEDDDEAAGIWLDEVGVDPCRFTRCGEKDNFWSMGDTGPCGPCSEVFYDHGPEVPGGPPGSPDEDGDRYVEIWNLVFMQFDRDAAGNMTPLPAPSVDTGMGLERVAAVMQGVHSNYDTDLFQTLIGAAAELTNTSEIGDKSLRVVADHIRAAAFLICDGVMPSNEGRGYVLRRIARRAIRHGHRLGMSDPFFYRLVAPLESEMGEAYPELRSRREIVERTLRFEEERFALTLDQGMRILNAAIEGLGGDTIPGETVFRLYDTYGFPVDLTADVARERNLDVDLEAFEAAMEAQRRRARASHRFADDRKGEESLPVDGATTRFLGYECTESEAEVLILLRAGESVDRLGPGEEGAVVLDRTPFYPEGGGQVGDRGTLSAGSARFEVRDTRRRGESVVHHGVLEGGELARGGSVRAHVDALARTATARHHSATHLLHAALREILGEHVEQKGSLVAPDRLRFDFSHYEPVRAEQLRAIERRVNGWVLGNDPARTAIMPLAEARASGAIALFAEKYDDPVRVLSIGHYSVELCGGTHVSRTGDIGLFKLISETGIAAGIRRVEALAGEVALDWLGRADERLGRLSRLVNSERDAVVKRVEQILARSRELEKELARANARLAASHGEDLAARAVDVGGLRVLSARVEGVGAKALRDMVDQLKNRLGSAAVVLAAVEGGKVNLVAGVTKDSTDRIAAGPLVNYVAPAGGRPRRRTPRPCAGRRKRPCQGRRSGGLRAPMDPRAARTLAFLRLRSPQIRLMSLHRAEVRRHFGRQHRTHRRGRLPDQAIPGGRPRSRGGGLRDERRNGPPDPLRSGNRSRPQSPGARRAARDGGAGHYRVAQHEPAFSWVRGAFLYRRTGSDPDRRCPHQGEDNPHRREPDPRRAGSFAGGGGGRVPGASISPETSPRSAAAVPTRPQSHWRRRSTPTSARYSPMSTGCTPRIRASCRRRAVFPVWSTKRCSSSRGAAPRCCRSARSNSPASTTSNSASCLRSKKGRAL